MPRADRFPGAVARARALLLVVTLLSLTPARAAEPRASCAWRFRGRRRTSTRR